MYWCFICVINSCGKPEVNGDALQLRNMPTIWASHGRGNHPATNRRIDAMSQREKAPAAAAATEVAAKVSTIPKMFFATGASTIPPSQSTLTRRLDSGRVFARHIELRNHMAPAFAALHWSYRTVEQPQFRTLITELNPRFTDAARTPYIR